VGKETALLVVPGAMLPVFQAPESEVEVWVGEVELVQVTVDPAVIRMGFGLKHQEGVPAQLMI
jgi:hypothetical protein